MMPSSFSFVQYLLLLVVVGSNIISVVEARRLNQPSALSSSLSKNEAEELMSVRQLQPGEPNYGLTRSEHVTMYGYADEAGWYGGDYYDGGDYNRGEHGCPWEDCSFYNRQAQDAATTGQQLSGGVPVGGTTAAAAAATRPGAAYNNAYTTNAYTNNGNTAAAGRPGAYSAYYNIGGPVDTYNSNNNGGYNSYSPNANNQQYYDTNTYVSNTQYTNNNNNNYPTHYNNNNNNNNYYAQQDNNNNSYNNHDYYDYYSPQDSYSYYNTNYNYNYPQQQQQHGYHYNYWWTEEEVYYKGGIETVSQDFPFHHCNRCTVFVNWLSYPLVFMYINFMLLQ